MAVGIQNGPEVSGVTVAGAGIVGNPPAGGAGVMTTSGGGRSGPGGGFGGGRVERGPDPPRSGGSRGPRTRLPPVARLPATQAKKSL